MTDSREASPAPLSVLFLSHAAGTPDLGPNLRVYSIGKYLARAGAEVTIAGSGTFHKYRGGQASSASILRAQVDGVEMIWLRTLLYRHRSVSQVLNQLHFPLRLLMNWKRLAMPVPDVIVVSSPPPFVAFVAHRLARKLDVPWVFEMRDLWPLVLQGIGSFSPRNPYIALLKATERFSVTRADRVVVVKPGDEDYVRRQYGRTAVTYIPNGIDPENLPDDGTARGPGSDHETERICYVGALTDYYVLDELLLAFERVQARYPRSELVIAGDGPRRIGLEELVGRRGIPRVSFLGRIGRGEVSRLLATSSIGYVGVRGGPADRHGISTNKLFEYMYSSLAVLACYETDHDPVTKARCGVTVSERTPDALARGLESLLSVSATERKRMGENGRDYVLDQHLIPRLSLQYGAMLRELSQGSPEG